ncbi:MAG: HD domain-containing protein [Bdellovibrionales bacterium]|nr:HD domain-containing protein [Bdellovibrionales bacterium]
MSKRLIREFKEKDHVQTAFLVTEKNAGKDRNGKSFLSLTLADASGHVNGRMFEKADEAAATFEVGDVVWLKGFVQLFQNRKQLIVHEVRKAQDGEYDMAQLVADLGGDPRKHHAELLELVAGLKNEYVRQILHDTLTEPRMQEILLRAPAAKTIHHAYRGGLIEHIHSIVSLMDGVAKHYGFLDRDLLVFGAIYHDIGKIYELDLTDGIHYTQSGRLVGHMVLACEMIDKMAAKISGFPDDLRDVLKHIVLSHHGKLEYGSPKLPMLPEAVVVSMIDDLDSKMNTLFHFLKNETQNVPPTEKWSHYHPGFERYFFLDFFRRQQGQG